MTETPARPARSGRLRRWPADPALFTDTSKCPACLAPLSRVVCATCGLDLSAPQAAEVLASGRSIVAEEQRRQNLIDAMFAAQAQWVQAPVQIQAQIQTPVAPTPAQVSVPAPPPFAAAPPIGAPALPPAPAVAMASAGADRPRRSGMQVFLLTLGVVLISVTAIVFLFVAYLIASLEVRSVIIAIASALVLGVAALLRRRGLPGTAEGIAVVAVVLLLLDVWIVRANDLFGTGALRPTAYTGIALLVLTAILVAARAATRVRALGITAAVLAPTAMLLLGIAAAPPDEPATAAWLGGIVALVPAIAAVLIRLPMLERLTVVALGAAGGGIAWCAAAFALPALAWHPLVAFAAVTVAWGALLAALTSRERELGVAWQWVAAIAAGSALAAGPALAIAVELDVTPAAWLAPTAGIAIAVLLSMSLRLTAPTPRRVGLGAFAGAGAIALFAAVPAGLAGAVQIGALVVGTTDGWTGSRDPGFASPTELIPAAVIVPFVLAGASTLVALSARRLRTLGAIPVALAGFGLIVGGAASGDLRLAVAVLLVTAAAGLAVGVVAPRIPIRALLPVLATVGPLAAALAWAAGFGATDVWAWSTTGALLLTLAGWRLAPLVWTTHPSPVATVHALLVALQVVVLGLALAPWLVSLGVPLTADWRTPTLWVALIAGGLFGAAVTLPLSRTPRLALTAPLLAASTIAVVALLVSGGTPLRALGACVVAVAAILWTWRGRLLLVTPAAAAIAPIMLTFTVAWFVGDVLLASPQADAGAAAAVLVSAALAHVVLRRSGGTDGVARLAWAASTGALTLVVFALGLIGADWLPLALLAPVPVVLAALWGEPIASTTPARHVAWAAPVIAIASWWTWLSDRDATLVELFTLPVAALCLAIGALIVLRRPLGANSAGRVCLFGAGLAIAVIPSVVSAADSVVRTILLVAIGAVLVLAAGFAPARVRGVPLGLLGVLAGATSAVGGAFVHAMDVARSTSAWTTEWWSLAGLVVGVGASVWWARADRSPRLVAEWVFAATIVAASAPTIVAIALGSNVFTRSVVLLPLLAVVHILTAALPRPVSGPISRWTTAGVLGVAAFIALLARVEPFDLVTVSVALAVIGAGVLDLRRRPGLGSWPALGTGLVVLLVPGLIADFTDPQLWRIVTLGVVALATLLAGIRWRLQAPFVLGGAVLLVHAIAQLWPWITWLYEAVWWWLWLGIAGVLLVVIAATYERQMRTARSAVTRLATLR